MKNFFDFISEKKRENNASYDEIIEDLKKMISDSLNTSDEKTIKDFIDAYLRDSEKTQIEGLINDSDIWEFYLKYRGVVDQVLSEIKFYEKPPSEMNTFGLYDYVITGTKMAIKELIGDID